MTPAPAGRVRRQVLRAARRPWPAGRLLRPALPAALLAALLLTAALPSPAQEAAGGPERAAPAAPAAPPEPPPVETLVRDTLEDDIASAGYYELVSELRRLGLDHRGGRSDLQARLRAHYGLPAVPQVAPGGDPPIAVRAAHVAEYFTLDEAGETYLRLRGGVELAVTEAADATVHAIRADEVIFNQTTGFLTARGKVEYTATTDEQVDTIQAHSLTLDTETFEAVFVHGRTEHEHDPGAGPVRFTFRGDTVTRLADDTIVFDGARITSSPDPDTPNYEIRAERMWILTPGEWGIRNATLYVGRVPVLYLPFYFRPGDRLVFHPAVGVRDREGLFLNTTLYLRGRRTEAPQPFALLSTADGRYREERHGLFLRPVAGAPAVDDDSFLKLMLDAYARLGFHAGVAGSFPGLNLGANRRAADGERGGEGGDGAGGVEASIAFQAGVARSRSVWIDPATGAYTAYDRDSGSGITGSRWHDASLLGLTVPLRYGAGGGRQPHHPARDAPGRVRVVLRPRVHPRLRQPAGAVRLVRVDRVRRRRRRHRAGHPPQPALGAAGARRPVAAAARRGGRSAPGRAPAADQRRGALVLAQPGGARARFRRVEPGRAE